MTITNNIFPDDFLPYLQTLPLLLQKPPDLCADLIEVFTKRDGRVLDPFAGVGGTLLGAGLRGRSAVGIEINPRWIEIYRQVCSLEKIPEQRMICGDSRAELPVLAKNEEEFDSHGCPLLAHGQG